jgi:hypothetical protein
MITAEATDAQFKFHIDVHYSQNHKVIVSVSRSLKSV